MNEACLNARWLKHDLTHKDAQDLSPLKSSTI
jgi:hypothetical protein